MEMLSLVKIGLEPHDPHQGEGLGQLFQSLPSSDTRAETTSLKPLRFHSVHIYEKSSRYLEYGRNMLSFMTK